VALLRAAGVPAAVVVHPSEQVDFEQLAARQFFENVVHPVAGDTLHVTFPFRLPGHVGPIHRAPAPTLGQHNVDVLGGLLGVTDAELARLAETGVIGTELSG
jgi:crotonobetainyl-CoA:carnitine CoA-transferase CaiB-like acyl-CoA transferase